MQIRAPALVILIFMFH